MKKKKDTPTTRTLRRAMEALGSAEHLAVELGCSLEQLRSWLAGSAMPTGAFIAALEIVAAGRPSSDSSAPDGAG